MMACPAIVLQVAGGRLIEPVLFLPPLINTEGVAKLALLAGLERGSCCDPSPELKPLLSTFFFFHQK